MVLDTELVNSIRTHVVIQPLLVTPHPEEEGRYQLVAGHHRLGAAREVGLERVPALVRALGEQERLELRHVDNLQQSDLSPSETASAMPRLGAGHVPEADCQAHRTIGGLCTGAPEAPRASCRRPLPRRRRNGFSVAAVQDSR